MRRELVLFLLPLIGCATPRGGTDLGGPPEVRTVTAGSVSSGDGGVSRAGTVYRYEEEAVLVEDTVPGQVAEALTALQVAYLAEGLAPDGVNAQAGIVSLSRVEWSRLLNGERLSAFLDCGLSSTGRPMADAARVVAALAGQVKEAGPDATRVTLRLSASAYPYENGSGAVRGCVTTGRLEGEIVARVRGALAPTEMAAESPARQPRPAAVPVPGAPATDARVGSAGSPASPGDQIRVQLLWGARVSGVYLQVRADTLILETGRRTPIPLVLIQGIQVKRTRRTALLVGAAVGVAAGVTLATTTDMGIRGQHAIQGRILNPGLGALVGGVAGLLVANWTLGTGWVEVPSEAFQAR